MKRARTYGRWLAGAALLAGIVTFLGCDDEKSYALYFSHSTHVTDYEVTCVDCHGAPAEGRFSSISHASCVDCHDDWMNENKVTEKTCGECHKERDLVELAATEVPDSVAPAAGAFVHTDALSNRCTECHSGLMGEKLKQVPEMGRDERLRMRTEAHAWGLDCAACHVDMDPDIAPPNHDRDWLRRHGSVGSAPENVCGTCHEESSCRTCHEEMMPDSHNNLWRRKTHGIEAAWDRDRCQLCHEEDSCDACHSEVRPASHNANWERNHCFQCHPSSSTGTGCTFCHEGGLDAHPDPHPAGWRTGHCRNCHNGTPQSEQCSVCHEGSGLDNHPNPHPAGWEKAHCNRCHGGDLNGVSCEACHGGDLLEDHPNPHPAGFTKTHCNQCHDGTLRGVSCTECHGGDTLEDHPNPHPPGFQNSHCNSCHDGSTVNGVSCAVCHGGDLLEDHPNPHNAGFENSHCNSCHAGSQAAEECEICHEGGSSVLVHEDFWPPVHNLFGDAANCNDCHF